MRPKLRIPDVKVQNSWPYFHVVLPPDLIDEIKSLAAKKGQRVNKVTEMLLRFALEHVADD